MSRERPAAEVAQAKTVQTSLLVWQQFFDGLRPLGWRKGKVSSHRHREGEFEAVPAVLDDSRILGTPRSERTVFKPRQEIQEATHARNSFV